MSPILPDVKAQALPVSAIPDWETEEFVAWSDGWDVALSTLVLELLLAHELQASSYLTLRVPKPGDLRSLKPQSPGI